MSVPGTRTATVAVAASSASILLMALFASVPGSPFLPELAPGVQPTGPLAWLADAIGLDSVHGTVLVMAAVIAAVAAACSFLLLLGQAWRGRLPLRTVVVLAVAAHIVVVLLPVLFSRDVYSYVAYGRIAGLYHANPYVQTPVDFPADPILPLVGHRWVDTPAVYGPLFTGLSAFLTRWVRSIPSLVTTFRLVAAAASLATVAVIARTTGRERPARAAFAAVAFGLNPVILFQSVGGGHNDLLVALAVAGAFALVLRAHTLPAVGVLALATMVKASAALPLLLLIVWVVARRPEGRRLRSALTHGGLAALIGAMAAAPFLQTQDPSLGMLELAGHEGWLAPSRLVRRALDFVSGDTLGVIARIGFAAALLICVVALARRLARVDVPPAELGAAWGWSLILLMLLGPVLLPWYVAWSLPLVWLLPRVPRTILIGTGVALAISQWATEPTVYPGAYDANVLVGHYVLTPVVLVWAGWLLLDLRRRFRDGLPLGPEAEAAEVPAAAAEH
ncbi:MAG: glycosyltransferase 87 family protein [Actinomycetota bacterium]